MAICKSSLFFLKTDMVITNDDIIINPDENQNLVSNDTLIIAGPDEKISDVVRPTNISAD